MSEYNDDYCPECDGTGGSHYPGCTCDCSHSWNPWGYWKLAGVVMVPKENCIVL